MNQRKEAHCSYNTDKETSINFTIAIPLLKLQKPNETKTYLLHIVSDPNLSGYDKLTIMKQISVSVCFVLVWL